VGASPLLCGGAGGSIAGKGGGLPATGERRGFAARARAPETRKRGVPLPLSRGACFSGVAAGGGCLGCCDDDARASLCVSAEEEDERESPFL
jgi:hypothetical protein